MKAIAKTVPGRGVELIDLPAPQARPGELLVDKQGIKILIEPGFEREG